MILAKKIDLVYTFFESDRMMCFIWPFLLLEQAMGPFFTLSSGEYIDTLTRIRSNLYDFNHQ
jgi:hypothetical protein